MCSYVGRKFVIKILVSCIHNTTYNTAVTDAASEILGKERRSKKPRVTRDFLTSVMRGEMKQKEQKNSGKQTRGFRR